MNYEKPNMELVELEVKDIITSSFGEQDDGAGDDNEVTTKKDWS